MTSTPGMIIEGRAVADRWAITDVLHAHCRGLDRLDADLLKACYWPDAELDYGVFQGQAHAFIDQLVAALSAGYALTRHTISNSVIQLENGHARVESHVDAVHLSTSRSAELLFRGRYLDTLSRRAGGWRITHRQVVLDWSATRKIVGDGVPDAFITMSRGSQDSTDPSLEFFSAAGINVA